MGTDAHDTKQYAGVRPLMTVAQLAEALKVGRGSVYKLVNSGQLPTVTVGRRLRFLPDDVDRFLEGRRDTYLRQRSVPVPTADPGTAADP